jgi:hypothetical protein
MDTKSKNGIIGLALVGIGFGLASAGVLLVIPVCTSWSRSKLQDAFTKGKEGLISGFERATDALGDVAAKAQQPLSDAAKAAKHTTSIAAGAIESAAHYVKERVQ